MNKSVNKSINQPSQTINLPHSQDSAPTLLDQANHHHSTNSRNAIKCPQRNAFRHTPSCCKSDLSPPRGFNIQPPMPTNNKQEQPTVPTVGGEDIHRMLEEALKKKQKQDKRKSTSKRHSSKRTSRSSRSHGAAAGTAAGVPVGATVKGSGAGGTIKGSGPGMPAEKFDPKATTSGDAFFAQFKAKQDKSYGPRYHG
jgi:hypothetical protein